MIKNGTHQLFFPTSYRKRSLDLNSKSLHQTMKQTLTLTLKPSKFNHSFRTSSQRSTSTNKNVEPDLQKWKKFKQNVLSLRSHRKDLIETPI